MESEQRNRTNESETISPETPSKSAPDISGFLANDMSRSAPEPEREFTDERTRPNGDSISTDDLFQVLSNRRRRYVLSFLKNISAEVDLGTLATQIAAWENNKEVSAVTGTERKRVYTSLQQVHLPKMDDIDILEFDKRAGTIRATSSLMGVELDPDISDGDTISWEWFYFALAGAAGGFIGLSTVAPWPAQLVSNPVATSVLVVLFLVLSAVQILVTR